MLKFVVSMVRQRMGDMNGESHIDKLFSYVIEKSWIFPFIRYACVGFFVVSKSNINHMTFQVQIDKCNAF